MQRTTLFEQSESTQSAKIFTNYTFDRRLVSKICWCYSGEHNCLPKYKRTKKKLAIKKTNDPILKSKQRNFKRENSNGKDLQKYSVV